MKVIYLGCNGFPFGLAQVERQKLIAKSLVKAGSNVLVINRVGVHDPDKVKLNVKGNIEGIDYVYTSCTPYRQSFFVNKCLYRILGIIGEVFYIIKLKLTSEVDFMLLSCYLFKPLRYYYFLSRLLRIKVVLDYVEYSSALIHPGLKEFENFSRFDKLGFNYTDFALCISNFLATQIQKQKLDLPIIKVPAICDFEIIDRIIVEDLSLNYFLFCGSAFYMEVIEFIIGAFGLSKTDEFYLYLIVNGKESEMIKLNELIENNGKRNKIKVFSNLEYNTLIRFYKQAKALLIPLRPTIQDEARFPHKIGEYTATGRPIITTMFGEIPYYFKDMNNALIASEYELKAFASKMDFVIQYPEIAAKIGDRGKALCKMKFDYRLYGSKIIEMVTSSIT